MHKAPEPNPARQAKTYYIDPIGGNSGRVSTSHRTVWRSFAPLNQMELAAGDCVDVSPGEYPGGLRLTGCGTIDQPIIVRLAPRRYDIHPDQCPRRRYDISNCNAEPDADKAVALLIEHAQHVRIEGRDARIVCHGKMIELCVDHSQNVTVTGLRFDYHRPTVSEMTVTATEDDHADLSVHADSTYRVEDGRLIWVGEGWEHDHGLAQELAPDEGRVWRRAGLLKDLRVEELAPGRLRVHGEHRMEVGRVFQIRDPHRDCCGVFLNRSRDITLRDVDLYFMHGMGVLSQFTENITAERVAIAPDPASGRTTAAWADCFHASDCRGKITVRDCTFRGAHDDAINIHGTYLRIVERPEARQIKVRFMHSQTFGFLAFNPGDEVAFVHADNLQTFAHNRVVEVESLSPTDLLLTLAEPAPAPGGFAETDVLENLTWTPQVEIADCRVSHIPTRGFLLTTPRQVVVRGCEFLRTHMEGIQMAVDANDWFESGPVRDMLITNNRFIECRRGGIRIEPSVADPTAVVHENIRIEGNHFTLHEHDPAVHAIACRGLTIKGNTVEAAESNRPFEVEAVRDVRVEANAIVEGD